MFTNKEWPFVFTCLDDTYLINSSSIEEHKEHASRVHKKLSDTGLTLTPEKFYFADWDRVFGYTLTLQGIKPNNTKVKVIIEFPQPKDVSSLKRFLGTIGNTWRILLLCMAMPLTALTQKDKTTTNYYCKVSMVYRLWECIFYIEAKVIHSTITPASRSVKTI